jgi:PAS domain S-box-containing protein
MKKRAIIPNDSWPEAEETLRAIRDGSVDAFVVEGPQGHRIFTLEGSDLPYSAFVERMQQGAAMLNDRGEIVYCNPSLATMIAMSREAVIGAPLLRFIAPADQRVCHNLLRQTHAGSSEGEMRLRSANGTLIMANFALRLLLNDKSTTGVLITDLTFRKEQIELASRLQRIQDEERRRIARELHDSVGQLLVAIGLNIARVQTESHKLTADTAKLIRDNAGMVNEITNEIRTISHLLHPPLLDEVGLPSALHWYIDGFAERSHVQATLDIPDDLERLPQDMEIAIFRAVQECLTNVHRHSGSPSCWVKIVRDAEEVRVEIGDSGRGISATRQTTLRSSGGVGLRGMEERFRQLGGSLQIQSSEKGTVVSAAFPISSNGDEPGSEDSL